MPVKIKETKIKNRTLDGGYKYQLSAKIMAVYYPTQLRRVQITRETSTNIYMLFAGWEVRIVKNCDRGLENAARGRRPRAAFSRQRSQFFTIRTDPKPVNNLFIFFLLGKKN